MLSPSTSMRLAVLIALFLSIPTVGRADEPRMEKSEARKAEEAIQPLPLVPIPDDPPPHEGALINIPYVVEPPDILVIEVLEALPGRPITGERLVRPDGTLSLGFYGHVSVRGLSVSQIKVKIVHHLREYMDDEVLGLIGNVGPVDALPKPGFKVPDDRLPKVEPDAPNEDKPAEPALDKDLTPAPAAGPPFHRDHRRFVRPSRRKQGRTSERARVARHRETPIQEPAPGASQKQKAAEAAEMAENPAAGALVYIDPTETPRVFVDIASFHSKVYIVQGDVSIPGRLPVTGQETVLDALNYAGGFVATAEQKDIHLYRPARGGKPAKDYVIDYEAILKGEARANLQMFPNDRLVIGRNAIVKKTVEIDRISAQVNSILNLILQYTFTARSLTAMNFPPGGAADARNGAPMPNPGGVPMTVPRRDASLREWVELLWDLADREAGKTLDEKGLREALLNKLATPPEPEKK